MSATTVTAYRSHQDTDRIDRNRRQVRRWLGFVLFTLFVLVLVGGATRLTESGLSITEWKPIHGVIPPITDAEVAAVCAWHKLAAAPVAACRLRAAQSVLWASPRV